MDLKCANCSEKHSANSKHCSTYSSGKNAAENEQCNVTHTCNQTIAATTSYIDRIPSCTFKGHRHQEESHLTYFSQGSQQYAYPAAAAKHHVLRSVLLAARGTSKSAASSIKSTVPLMNGCKDNSTGQQLIKLDHKRKRTAAQALETPATKKPTASEATAQETTTSESAAFETTVFETTVAETKHRHFTSARHSLITKKSR